MQLNNLQRLALLSWHLLKRPRYIPAYARHLPMWGRLPVDLGLPWWPYVAIERLRTLLRPGLDVLEFGTGGSTILMAAKQPGTACTCIEDDPRWLELVRGRLQAHPDARFSIHLAELPGLDQADPRWQAYLSHAGGQYDLIIIDGQELAPPGAADATRIRCFQHAERHIRPGGVIIVDDSWRYPSLRVTSRACRHEIQLGVGPCRVGVSSTDFFFY